MNEDDSAKRPATELPAKLDEAEYIARLRSGDEDALDELSTWLCKNLPRYIVAARGYRLEKAPVRDEDVEEWAADLALHIRKNLPRFSYGGPRSFIKWVARILINKVSNELKKRRSLPRLVEFSEEEIALNDQVTEMLPDYEATFLDAPEPDEQGATVSAEGPSPTAEMKINRRALSLLGDRDRWILIETLTEDKDYGTIAREELAREYQGGPVPEEVLKKQISNLRQLRSRAEKRLRKIKSDLEEGKPVRRKRTRSS